MFKIILKFKIRKLINYKKRNKNKILNYNKKNRKMKFIKKKILILKKR